MCLVIFIGIVYRKCFLHVIVESVQGLLNVITYLQLRRSEPNPYEGFRNTRRIHFICIANCAVILLSVFMREHLRLSLIHAQHETWENAKSLKINS